MFKKYREENALDSYDFRSDIFPTVNDRKFWDEYQDEDVVALAENALDYRWPVILATDFMEFKLSGERTVMENTHFDRRNHLVMFVIAELKENKGRFLSQIVNGLFAIAEESYWGVSAHVVKGDFELPYVPSPKDPYIDLFAAETAEHLAMTITLLREPLLKYCPDIVDRIEYEIDRRIKIPYESRYDFWWMGHGTKLPNNWNPWILSNVITVFLLCEQSESRKKRAIRKALCELGFYYDIIPADGGCDEGPVYWSRAGASLFECLYLIKESSSGKLDLFKDEKIKLIASYMKKAHIHKDYFVNVADAHATGQSDSAMLLYGYAKNTCQPDIMNFASHVYKEKTASANPLSYTVRTVRRLILKSVYLREIEKHEVSLPVHGSLELLPEMELAVLREGELILSAKGGHNDESHNHNDIGSFSLYENDAPILVDVGINTYTRFTFSKERYTMIPWTQAKNHNIPIINGTEQHEGRCYEAESFAAEAGRVEISFANAYTSDAGIDGIKRELTLSKSGMICRDSIAFKSDARREATEVVMSILPPRVEKGRVILGERYILEAHGAAIGYEYLSFNDPKLESDWKCEGVYRITLSYRDVSNIEFKLLLGQ